MDSSTSDDERSSTISSGKKVRFDLNDEVFEIPNKWDRLSTRMTARRNKLLNDVSKNKSSKVSDSEHRSRHKQTKTKRVKKTVKNDNKSHHRTSRTLTSPPSQVLSLDSSVLNTQIPQKRGGLVDKTVIVDLKTKKVSPTYVPEVKLKLSHRGSRESSPSDIVLPTITYSSDLKKAIENAVVRNRIPSQECLIPAKEHRQESITQTLPKHSSVSNSPNKRLLTEEIRYSTRKEERFTSEQEPKFSELSREVESWIPFTNSNKETRQKKSKGDGTIQQAWVVPNSILY